MSERYVVVVHPGLDLNVTVCGPYRTRAKAEEAAVSLAQTSDKLVDGGMAIANAIPQVVPLDTVAAVRRSIHGEGVY